MFIQIFFGSIGNNQTSQSQIIRIQEIQGRCRLFSVLSPQNPFRGAGVTLLNQRKAIKEFLNTNAVVKLCLCRPIYASLSLTTH